MSAATPARTSPSQREMMFCHECHDEWYRDERGIICPECGSEFTEIVRDVILCDEAGHDSVLLTWMYR